MKLVATLLVVGLAVTASLVSARTWYILPNGTGDAPTIQAGVDSCVPYDTVLVGPGTYYETVKVFTDGVTVISESGPGVTTIDAEQNGRPLTFGEVFSGFLSGLRFIGGDAGSDSFSAGWGGGLLLLPHLMVVENCIVEGNTAAEGGGVFLFCDSFDYFFRSCLVANNTATDEGGGIRIATNWDWGPWLQGNTITGNSAPLGGGIYYAAGSAAVVKLHNNVVANNVGGYGVYGGQNDAVATCNDVWGNTPGNYGWNCSDRTGTDGNISVDPLFCNSADGDFRLDCASPCLPGNHPDGADCGLIGVYGVGCGPSAVERTTWGAIKAMYR